MQKRASLASSLPSYQPGPPSRSRFSGTALIALLFLAGLLLIGFLAWTFIRNVNENGDPDPPVITASLRDGDAVLLNQRILLRVEASSANPVTTARLFVDGLPAGDDTPFFSEPRGVYIASLPWTPASLGRADLRIVHIDDADAASEHLIRVDVTDDPSLVNSALRLSIVGIEPFQNVYLGRPIRLRASAQGDEPITRFSMLVNGAEAVSAEALLNDQGVYSAAWEWTPAALGAADIEIRAVSASGDIPARSLTVSVIESPGSPAAVAAASAEQSQDQASDSVPASYARILSPAHQSEIELGADGEIELEIGARGTGPLSSVALYITPIDDLGNLGSSEQIWQRIGTLPPNGEFVDVVRGIQRHLDGYGWYQFEIVAFTTAGQRFDHFVDLRFLPPEEGAAADFSAEPPPPPEPGIRGTDLGIVSVVAARDGGVEVSVINSGSVDRASVPLAVVALRPETSAELHRHEQNYSLAVGQVVTISLPIVIEQTTDLLILLEADYDIDDADNSLSVTLEPPSSDIADLAILDAILDDSGRVIIAVSNSGTSSVSAYSIRVAGADGPAETILRGQERPPLEPGDAEAVPTIRSHNPPVSILLDPDGEFDENPENNRHVLLPVGDELVPAEEEAAPADEETVPADDEEDDLLLDEDEPSEASEEPAPEQEDPPPDAESDELSLEEDEADQAETVE